MPAQPLAAFIGMLCLLSYGLNSAEGTCTCPTVPRDGTISGCTSPASEGTEISYLCSSGFVLVGDYTRTCQADTTWSEQEPYCNRVCACPPEPANGFTSKCYRIPGSSQPGSSHVVDYHCNVGYHLSGVSTRTCLRVGRWSDSEPQCIRSVCQCQRPPVNGSASGCVSEVDAGRTVTFSCEPGSSIVGPTSTTCLVNATWSASPPTCQQFSNCVCPQAPVNGITMGCNGTSNLVYYSCNSGYILAGTGVSRTCTSTGDWSGRQPSCIVPPATSSPGIVLTDETLAIIIVCSSLGFLCLLVVFVGVPAIVCLCRGRGKHQTHELPTGSAGNFSSGASAYPTLRYETGSEDVTSPIDSYPTLRHEGY